MPFGKIEQYDINSHNWDAYVRRIKQFIMLNGIKEDLHVDALVTHVGVTCYELMCDLCAPKLPEEKSFTELTQIVKEHLEPQRSEIAERHVFRQRKQQQGETISDYLQVLKHLAKTCNFSNMLEVNLRDQFVSGLCSEDLRSRLFAEKNIDYKRAVELALESAERHAAVAGSVRAAVGAAGPSRAPGAAAMLTGAEDGTDGLHHVAAAGRRRRRMQGAAHGSGSTARREECFRCGKSHAAFRCRFKYYSCDQCGEKGHLKVMCRKSESRNNGKGQFYLEDEEDSDGHFYNIVSDGDKPFYLDLQVDTKIIKFEVDTGSKISVISYDYYCKQFSDKHIVREQLRLKSYTGDIISALGYISVSVKIDNNNYTDLQLYVIKNGGPPLLGRTWIRCLNLTGCYNVREVDPVVDGLRKEFPEVFAGGLGTFKSRMQFHFAHETPIFVKARPLPLALRARVESELKRLQREDVMCKVGRSDYGTPIVPVVKANGDIRICGDYKITINPRLKDYHYPLPRIDEIFAALGGGQQYSKLDLSHAYQQVLLNEDSQPMTAITTHLGTFVCL